MTETRTIIDAFAERAGQAELTEIDGIEHLVAAIRHPGSTVELLDIEKHLPTPRRVRQQVRLDTPKSFAEYVNAFQVDGQTRIFADVEKRLVVARIDWHEPSDASGEDATPSWATHSATMTAAYSDPFGAWLEIDGRWLAQREFAEFLEDRAGDAVAPDPADLMEVASRFEAVRKAEFTSVVNVHTNERQFKYQEQDAPGGAIACPKVIRLRTPIFYGCEPTDWGVRFAYDIDGGKLKFKAAIHRRRDLIDVEFQRLCDAIAVDCPSVPVHRGGIAG